MLYVGIDVAKAFHVAAAVDEGGGVVGPPFSFSNDAAGFASLASWLQSRGAAPSGSLVVLEATGHYHVALARHLAASGWRVAVVNPARVSAFRRAETVRKCKTDAVDAVAIAQFGRFYRPEPVPALPPDAEGLRHLTRCRSQVVAQRTQAKNRLTAVIDRVFPEFARVMGGLWSASSRAVLAAYPSPCLLADADPEALAALLSTASRGRHGHERACALVGAARASVGCPSEALSCEARVLLGLLDGFDRAIAELDVLCAEQLAASSAAVLLTVPGLGVVTAAAIASELGDASSFGDASKVIAYAGMDASRFQSGQFEGRRAHMSKRGSPYLRRALMIAADAARRADPYYGDYYQALRDRGKHHWVAVSAVARKLAGTILAVWREQRPYEPREPVAAHPRE
ncbi:MAG: IS110 family transposase [Eggerthellaceae bacterium]|nr:IS110 family transposase [Eggerthellaceae bacterium]